MSLSKRAMITNNEPEFLTEYRKAIEVTQEQRDALLAEGQLDPISSEIGLDDTIKQNFLLTYAMSKPREYIRKRIDMLLKIKEAVNKKYVEVFNEERKGVPIVEAKKVAMASAKNYMVIEMIRLESMYPQRFGVQSYNNALTNEIAKHQLSLNDDEVNK
jgi:hypothetical protein